MKYLAGFKGWGESECAYETQADSELPDTLCKRTSRSEREKDLLYCSSTKFTSLWTWHMEVGSRRGI